MDRQRAGSVHGTPEYVYDGRPWQGRAYFEALVGGRDVAGLCGTAGRLWR